METAGSSSAAATTSGAAGTTSSNVEHSQPGSTLLGWPLLIALVAYVAWFLLGLWRLLAEPVVHEGTSTVDHRWATLLQPTLFVPVAVVFSYFNWVGWKFFQHN